MDIRNIITTPAQSATPSEGTTSSPNNDATRDGNSSDNENEPSSYQEMIEKWGEDMLNENGPFRNVDMKKLILAMVREAGASDFDDMIKSLPNYEDVRKQGRSFFSDANESFWKTVKTWERKLRAGEFNTPIPASMEEEEELLPYKDDAFLELWSCRVKISIEQHKLKKLKLQRARIIKHHQQKKNQHPIHYFVEGLSVNELQHINIICDENDLVKFSPPPGRTCGDHTLNFFSNGASGYTDNLDSMQPETCVYCEFSTGKMLCSTFDWSESNRWRNLGVIIAFFIFNIFCLAGMVYCKRRAKR